MILYGTDWGRKNRVEIECAAIHAHGRWRTKNGEFGLGLFYHYKQLQGLLWPWKKWDRWSELILENLINNKLTILIGPASSTKTHNVAAFMLCRYFSFPRNSCNLVSSTDSRSLELRIWGEIKKLWNEAKARWPECPGRMIESKQMLVTDVEDSEATDYRNGIIGIPCQIGGTNIGLSKLVGFKNGSVFLAADELSFMPGAFLDCISNLNKNPGFRCAGMGNPKDRTDTFGRLAEPAQEDGGWEGYEPTGKTMTWPTRFAKGMAVQLDGRGSPNNDAEEGAAFPYPYIINRNDIAKDIDYYGEDSVQVAMMDYGIFPRDAQAKRVITRTMVERFRAQEEPTWSGEKLTKLFAFDAAYGAVGGDRCVGVELHFGKCTDGVVRLAFAGNPILIPVKAGLALMPEEQIVAWVKSYCESGDREIPPSHVGFDSTGRGSLVSAFAREWSPDIVPIEFGGPPTIRYVSQKIKVECRVYYYNFVAELWFSAATAIESDQIRGLPTSVMEEGCLRAWEKIKDKKLKVETKAEMKKRMNRSPDVFDSFVCGVELARRLGFVLGQAGAISAGKMPKWLQQMVDEQRKIKKGHELVYR